jgi:hypothetical protein
MPPEQYENSVRKAWVRKKLKRSGHRNQSSVIACVPRHSVSRHPKDRQHSLQCCTYQTWLTSLMFSYAKPHLFGATYLVIGRIASYAPVRVHTRKALLVTPSASEAKSLNILCQAGACLLQSGGASSSTTLYLSWARSDDYHPHKSHDH